MTREEKLERMARAWCLFHGWVPDHRPLEMRFEPSPDRDLEKMRVTKVPGKCLWEMHVPAMAAVLDAIEAE